MLRRIATKTRGTRLPSHAYGVFSPSYACNTRYTHFSYRSFGTDSPSRPGVPFEDPAHQQQGQTGDARILDPITGAPMRPLREFRAAIDRRGLYKTGKSPYAAAAEANASGAPVKKSPETPLVAELKEQILLRGPLSMAEWMQFALGHPQHGYYMRREAIGGQGADFITSPELASIYGEMICVWCVSLWMKLGRPTKFRLVELGPGRGTLMKDILETATRFPEFYRAMSVCLVENSVKMRERQRAKLGVVLNEDNKQEATTSHDQHDETPLANQDWTPEERKMGQQLVYGVYTPQDPKPLKFSEHEKSADTSIFNDPKTDAKLPQIPVSWHWTLQSIPDDAPYILIANEFFDALPVHQFQYTERGWCEILVDIDAGPGPHHFKYVLSPGPTPATRSFVTAMNSLDSAAKAAIEKQNREREEILKFGYRKTRHIPTAPMMEEAKSERPEAAESTVAMEEKKEATATSESAQIQEVSPTNVETPDVTDSKDMIGMHSTKIGDTYEVSPQAFMWMERIAMKLIRNGGGALVVDYGDNDTGFRFVDATPASGPETSPLLPLFADKISRPLSVMGIKGHEHADVLAEPGLVDLSAHVNFGALAAVTRRTQNQVDALLAAPKGSKEYRKALESLGILPKRQKRRDFRTPTAKDMFEAHMREVALRPPQEEKDKDNAAVGDIMNKPLPKLHKLNVYPAITQSRLLQQLGIEHRFEVLLNNLQTDEEKHNFWMNVNRLVDPAQMGELFKAMAVVQESVKDPVGWSTAELQVAEPENAEEAGSETSNSSK